MARNGNIQARVAEEILQTSETFSFGGVAYKVAPPTFGTLVAVSGMLRGLPEKEIEAEKGKEFGAIVSAAYRYGNVPRIVALLILGAKAAKEPFDEGGEVKIFKRLSRRKNAKETGGKTKLDALAEKLSEEASARELKEAVAPLIERLELKDFFVLTTFLHRLNVTKPTKVGEATAPGR